jgi:hypothetical protein
VRLPVHAEGGLRADEIEQGKIGIEQHPDLKGAGIGEHVVYPSVIVTMRDVTIDLTASAEDERVAKKTIIATFWPRRPPFHVSRVVFENSIEPNL